MEGYILVGGKQMSTDYLREVTEEEAVKTHPHFVKSEVIRAWKLANKKTTPTKDRLEKK